MLRNLTVSMYRSLLVRTETKPYFSLVGAGLVALALALVHAQHELWRDEMHCWTLARNANGLVDILTGVRRYDGHPFLWYYLLHLVSRLSRSVVMLHGTTIVLATLSSYLWLRDVPLPRLLRLPLLASYLFFYEYGVLSRSYALGLLCLFLFCRTYQRQALRLPLLSLLLVLLTLTSAYGALLAVALALVLYVQGFVDVWAAKPEDRSRTRTGWSLAGGMVVFALGLLLFWTTSVPPNDSFFAIPGLLETVPTWPALALRYWMAHFPRHNPGNGTWMVTAAMGDQWPSLARCLPWAGLALFLSWLVALRRVPLVAMAYGVGVLAMAAFQHYQYAGFLRHFGHYVVWLVACVWLHEKQRSDERPSWLMGPLLALTLLAQVATGVAAVRTEVQSSFSGSLQAARFLRASGFADAPIVGSFDHMVSTVAGYLDRPFHAAETNEVVRSVTFHRRRWQGIPMPLIFAMATTDARRTGTPAILILNHDLDGYRPNDATVDRLLVTAPAIVADERFWIFRVTPRGAR